MALDVLTFDPATGRFAGTGLLDTIRKDAPQSLWAMAQVQPAPGHWKLWAEAPEAVRTGRSQADVVHGMPVFEYFATQPEEARIFSRAMTDLTGPIAPEAAAVIDASGIRRVIDVGGADGTFCYDVLERNPGVEGVVHDLPHVVEHALAERDRRGLTDRVTVEAGDIFEAVPVGDLCLLKFVMHDWTDESCVRILWSMSRVDEPGCPGVHRRHGGGHARRPTPDARRPTPDARGSGLGARGDPDGHEHAHDHGWEGARSRPVRRTPRGRRRVRTTSISAPYSVIEAIAV